jgi:hypothetical protein
MEYAIWFNRKAAQPSLQPTAGSGRFSDRAVSQAHSHLDGAAASSCGSARPLGRHLSDESSIIGYYCRFRFKELLRISTHQLDLIDASVL